MAFHFRILVTGSRDWQDAAVIRTALDKLGWEHDWALTVVHGACPTGADAHAARWCRDVAELGVLEDPHPAVWRPGGIYNPSAGFDRNRAMVDAGANLCLAFVGRCGKAGCPKRGVHGSHGATHCVGLARAAGIDVRRWEAP